MVANVLTIHPGGSMARIVEVGAVALGGWGGTLIGVGAIGIYVLC